MGEREQAFLLGTCLATCLVRGVEPEVAACREGGRVGCGALSSFLDDGLTVLQEKRSEPMSHTEHPVWDR